MNWRRFLNPKTLKEDIQAGVVLGVESVPDGMASGLLASVNPIYGVYGYMFGTFSGAFFTSSVFMSIQATSAMALVVASVPQVRSGDDADAALFTLAILTGVFMAAAGMLKLGRVLRWVPNAVMVGFINAVATLIILGQLSDFTGVDTSGANKLVQTFDLLQNYKQIQTEQLTIGALTILLIVALGRTRLKALGLVVAVVLTSVMVRLLGWDQVALVEDIASIPSSLPGPVLPSFGLALPLIVPAFALTFVGLVQGASISQSVRNPDGALPDASRDFIGQGVANLVSGTFQGTPVGGSMSATSLVTAAGARSRFANIFAGITMAIAILVFGRAIGLIAMPALAGLLIVIGFGALKPGEAVTVWGAGTIQKAVIGITFLGCLIIPLQYAVLIGVAISILLFAVQQSSDLQVVSWNRPPEGLLPIEGAVPEELPSNEVTVLVPYGALFFATASQLGDVLPSTTPETRNAVVIIHLQRARSLGSTFVEVLDRYASDLIAHQSKLVLVSVEPDAHRELRQTGLARKIGEENIYERGGGVVGQTLIDAWDDAEAWVAERAPHPATLAESSEGDEE